MNDRHFLKIRALLRAQEAQDQAECMKALERKFGPQGTWDLADVVARCQMHVNPFGWVFMCDGAPLVTADRRPPRSIRYGDPGTFDPPSHSYTHHAPAPRTHAEEMLEKAKLQNLAALQVRSEKDYRAAREFTELAKDPRCSLYREVAPEQQEKAAYRSASIRRQLGIEPKPQK